MQACALRLEAAIMIRPLLPVCYGHSTLAKLADGAHHNEAS